MSDEALIASAQAWPERARRRGALAAATLAMFVNLAWATSIGTGPPDAPWGMVLLDLLPIPLTCVVLPLLGPGALRQVVASRASAPGMLAGLTVGIWTALSSVIGLWFPSSITGVGPTLAPGSDPYGYASWAFASSVTVILTGPLVEEWLFRGVLWTSMMRMSNPLITTLVTAGLFTVCHGPHRVPDFPELFLSGLLLGMLRYRTNSLLPGVLAHSLGNLAATFGPCLAV